MCSLCILSYESYLENILPTKMRVNLRAELLKTQKTGHSLIGAWVRLDPIQRSIRPDIRH